MGLREEYLARPPLFEKDLLYYFQSSDPITIFDVGSCEGLDSIKYARYFPQSKIHAFEPIKSNCEKIESNLTEFNIANVQIHNVALSNKPGNVELFKSSTSEESPDPTWTLGNKSSSILEPKEHLAIYDSLKFEETEKVETQTMESFCQDRGIPSIELLHLDVQGAELMVLEGAGDFLRNIRLIWMEVAYMELYSNQPLRNDVIKFLKESGFILIMEDDRFYNGDHLYINEDFVANSKGDQEVQRLKRRSFFIEHSLRTMSKNLRRTLVKLKGKALAR